MPPKRKAVTALPSGGSTASSSTAGNKKAKVEKKQKWYGVKVGRAPGVYETWDECKRQIDGFPGAQYKSWPTPELAKGFVAGQAMVSDKYYAVAIGRETGIFRNYDPDRCVGVAGAKQHSYKTEAEAVKFIKQWGSKETIKELGKWLRQHGTKEGIEAFEQGPSVSKSTNEGQDGTTKSESKAWEQFDENGALKIYTDGSSRGNGQAGSRAGFGVFFGPNDPRNIGARLAGDPQTNNRAELMAILRALESVPKDQNVNVHVDSQYSLNCVTKWYRGWEVKNWMTSAGQPVLNKDEIEAIVKLIRERGKQGGETEFTKVPAHAKNVGNEAADRLANKGAMMPVV